MLRKSMNVKSMEFATSRCASYSVSIYAFCGILPRYLYRFSIGTSFLAILYLTSFCSNSGSGAGGPSIFDLGLG